ncbi:Bug family tripartite tricarboxylate transporter substrate binding protein [Acidovorax sacchari]|uniref:Bug family tripartite tricarboxylate transporter substrate binding protein n=1 Tax=Acidovorax sacchari TaxID=3230736 RepID=UPI0039E31EB8
MKPSLLRVVRSVAALAACCSALFAGAADAPRPWPTAKPITWVVGYVPGGSVDVLTRAIAKVVSEKIGQSIVIDNRPGASGALALQYVSRAPNDGYTLLTVPGPIIHTQRQPEIGRELAAVALMSQGPIVMVGTMANAPSDLRALIAAMKQHPDRWSFASSGTGTGQHLAGELFNTMAGTAMVHVPYKGGGQAVTDIVGGQVTLGMLGVTPVLSQIKAGQLKAYAVTTRFRIPSLPDVPTMEEAGLKGYDATQFFVAAAPRGIDPAIVAKLNATIAEALQNPEVKLALEASGQVGGHLSPAATQDFVVNSLAKFNALVHTAKIPLN